MLSGRLRAAMPGVRTVGLTKSSMTDVEFEANSAEFEISNHDHWPVADQIDSTCAGKLSTF